jgi:hypothetical protein
VIAKGKKENRRSAAPALGRAFLGFDRALGLVLLAGYRRLHGADYLVYEVRYGRYHFIPPLPDAGALGVIIYGRKGI